jgi:hypothetical protein
MIKSIALLGHQRYQGAPMKSSTRKRLDKLNQNALLDRLAAQVSTSILQAAPSLHPDAGMILACAQGLPSACEVRDCWAFRFPVTHVN